MSGKGISAALLMAFVRPVMRAALDRNGDPVVALERTNTILSTERRTGLFVTALAAVIELDTGETRLANAGHEPPIVVTSEGRVRVLDGPAAPLLGAFSSLGVPEERLTLELGDSLVLYTDGVTDARNVAGERFEADRFVRALGSTAGPAGRPDAGALRSAVLQAVDDFTGPSAAVEPADDLALLVVRRRDDR